MHAIYYLDEATQAIKQYVEGDTFLSAVIFVAPVHDINTWSEVRRDLANVVASIDRSSGEFVLPCGTVREAFKYGDPVENAQMRLLWSISDEPDDMMKYVARKLDEIAQYRRESAANFTRFAVSLQAARTPAPVGGTGGGPYMGP